MRTTRLSATMAGSAAVLCTLPLCLQAGSYTNDFSAGATGLTIYTITGAAPEVRTTDGNPGGYLKLTDAVNSTTSTVIFPDLDGGYPVEAFTFEVDCRIGNGTEPPADGFSINFARTGDPTIATGAGFVNGAAEDGTPTGLSIGFDCYDSGNGDVVGFTIKLDGAILQEVPATTRNGALEDPQSLQTGPIGSAGWAKFKVELKPDGNLNVFWKGTQVITELATGWDPSGGRLVFGARTGGLNQAHHFDNIVVNTTPAPLAAVTSVTATSAGYEFKITDFGTTSVVTPATVGSLSIDGAVVTPSSVTKTGSVTTVVYTPATPLLNRSSHPYVLSFEDQNGTDLIGQGTVTTPFLPAAEVLAGFDAPAGAWLLQEARQFNPPLAEGELVGDIGRAADLVPTFVDPYTGETPFINFFDPNTNGGGGGLFRYDQNFFNNTDADDNNIIQVAKTTITITGTTPAELQRSFWVQSDDGFALRIKGAQFINKSGAGQIDPADPQTIGFTVGTGNSDTRGLCQFPAAGDYVVEFLWFEGGGGAYNEVAWANGDFINNQAGTIWRLVGGEQVAPILPEILPVTPTGAPAGQWNVRELRGNYGVGLVAAITAAGQGQGTATDGVSPVINFNDLDGATGNSLGLFRNDLPYLSNTVGDDNDIITVAKTTLNIPAGTYTIGVISDDGWALTIPGTWFTGTNGLGALDPKGTTTLYGLTSGDTPTLGVLHVPVTADYEVFFLAQENGGGAGWEVFYASGAHGSVGATSSWRLLGDDSAVPVSTPLLPATLPGPEGSAGLWGLRFIRGVTGQGDNIYNAVASAVAAGGTITDATASYLNHADLDGGQTDLGLFTTTSGTAAYQVQDLEYDGSTGADDQIIGIAKATIEIPAGQGGEWTFGVRSDDGFALRIDGAEFTRVSGGSFIDPGSKNTVYFRFGTGNSDARAVTTLTEGRHTVEFLWFEGGSGSYFELFAAQGGFNGEGDTQNWRLVGGPEGLPLVDPDGGSGSSGFVITSLTAGPTPGTLNLTFPSEAGVSYEIEYSETLTGTWPGSITVTGTAGSTTTTVDAAALSGGTAPQRLFFRVRRP